MKVLVTGGAGYTGIPLCRRLLADGHDVVIVDRLDRSPTALVPMVGHSRLRVVRGDVRRLDKSLLRDVDAVYHLAGVSGYPECAADPVGAETINLDATVDLATMLADEQVLIFASTTSFYGASGDASTEETPPSPVSLYGETKMRAEESVMTRPNSVSLRWATVFGVSPVMRMSLMVNDFVMRAMEDRVITLYDGDSRRSFIHIDDQVDGYLLALESIDKFRGQVVNMGAEHLNLTKREVAQGVANLIPCEIIDAGVPDRDARHFYVSYAKARALGFECTRSLDYGIRELEKVFAMFLPRPIHL